MKQQGRPRMPSALRKSRRLWLGLTEEQYQVIRRAARKAGKDMVDWARDAALSHAAIVETATRTA